MNAYNKQQVTLETDEGTATDEKSLRDVWEERIKRYFPHYKLIRCKFKKEKGRKRL